MIGCDLEGLPLAGAVWLRATLCRHRQFYALASPNGCSANMITRDQARQLFRLLHRRPRDGWQLARGTTRPRSVHPVPPGEV
jgi:hypothetical protein